MGKRVADLIPSGARRPATVTRMAAVLSMAMLAGCMTGYGGGYGGYPDNRYPDNAYPGGYPGAGYPGGAYPDRPGAERMFATVQQVDSGYGRLLLTAESGGYGGGSQPVEVFFDRGTRLVYRGQQYPVEGLERGDRISLDVERSGNRLWARHIEVVQNIRESRGGQYPQGGDLSGAVSHVDPRRRLIEVTRGGYAGRREQVFYDDRTRVQYRGQTLRPELLEPGDVIRVQARPVSGGWLAERIEVEINARSR